MTLFFSILNSVQAFFNQAYEMIYSLQAFSDEDQKIRRQMLLSHSWFDKLSAQWAQQSFLQKTAVFVGGALFSGFIGLAYGAPMLFSMTVLFVFSVVHFLVMSHYQSHIEHIKILTKETQEHLEQMKELEEGLRKSMSLNQELKDQLTNTNALCEEQADKLKDTSSFIVEVKEELKANVECVNNTSKSLQQVEKSAAEALLETRECLVQIDKVVEDSKNELAQSKQTDQQLIKGIVALEAHKQKQREVLGTLVQQIETQIEKETIRQERDKEEYMRLHTVIQSDNEEYSDETFKATVPSQTIVSFDEVLVSAQTALQKADRILNTIDLFSSNSPRTVFCSRVPEVLVSEEVARRRAGNSQAQQLPHHLDGFFKRAHPGAVKSQDINIDFAAIDREISDSEAFIKELLSSRAVYH